MSRVFNACRILMAAARSGTKAAAAASPAAKPAKKTTGILKPLPVSPAMRKFVGASEISRTDAVKKIWDHIKLKQLQNPTNRKEIHCDEKLKSIFGGREKVEMLEIAKLLSPHFIKADLPN